MARDDILLAAAQVFRRKGFHGASMQDIADAVGLQKASLYHHVHSKQEILLALLDRALDLLIADLEPIAAEDGPSAERLRRAVRSYMARLTQEPDLAAVLLLEYRNLEPDLRRRHMPRRDRFESLWRDILRRGSERGDFRHVDAAIAGAALLGVQNWSITWYRRNGRLSPDQLADQFSDLMLRGLEPRAKSSR
jgi:AcrR family transcriptional regulator